MAKYLVTGGAGFIGHHLVGELLANGEQVIIIDNLSTGKKERINPQAEFILADITDYSQIARHFVGIDGVFHLAALPRVQLSIEDPVLTNNVNINGTLNVLLAAKEAKVGRVVYSASSSAYGDQNILPLHEKMLPKPKSPYGLQKYVGEHYCRIFSEVYGLPTICLRYFNVFGPGMADSGAYLTVIMNFLMQKKNGQKMTITGDGEQTRDFTFVKDVVRANILAMQSAKAGKGEVLNIGAHNNISVNKLADLIGGEKQYIAARIEPKHTLADISLAKELIGWEPLYDFESGLKEAIAWFEKTSK